MKLIDIAVYNVNGQLTLAVEVKNKLETSNDWAARMRRNVLAHGLVPKVRFFLLALPDRFYLWKDMEERIELVKPTYEIDPRPFLHPYYKKSGLSPDRLSGQSFELIVTSWLGELLRADLSADTLQHGQKWLLESGLLEAIAGGYVAAEVPA